MRKLNEQELKNLKEQLGGDVHVFDEPSEDTSEKDHITADARVPSLEELRDDISDSHSTDASYSSSGITLKRRNSARKGAPKGGRSSSGTSDFSVRFGSKNSDKGSKVAIVSGKSKKIVYEQG
jgi:hypothetical protein